MKNGVKRTLSLLSIVSALALNLPRPALAQAQAGSSAFEQMKAYYIAGRFADTINQYSQLSADDRQRPQVPFWLGQSYLRRHDYKSAEQYFQLAARGKLFPQQQEATANALQRIEILKRLCPPALTEFKDGGYTITVYAKPTPWSKLVAGQMPVFLARAKEAFGDAKAHINFYLFEERAQYDQFFGAWTIRAGETEGHRGTGGIDLVEFCQYFPNGSKVGEGDVNDLFARVLHEYSHALCHTIYGDSWGHAVPQWLNEGMADYFCARYKPDAKTAATKKLAQLAKTRQPPSYELMSRKMYSINFGYTVADVMVNELFDKKNLSVFNELINTARADGGDFEGALKKLTGKDPRTLYAQLIHTYWKR